MTPRHPTLGEATRVWAQIALLSFGGPAGQIAIMHRILVEERRWISESRFLHALNFCMVLPGPEAQQLATYIGWLLHGVRGALVAGLLFILPGAVSIMVLSWVYALWGNVGIVAALFFGLKAAVLAIVLQAVVRLGRRALHGPAHRGIAAATFVAIFGFGAPFPVIIAGAALVGWVGARAGWAGFSRGHAPSHRGMPDDADDPLPADADDAADPTRRAGALRAGAAALALWLAPVAALVLVAPGSVQTDIATFFSKLAVLTFGGAYAVLGWVAQEAVDSRGWLTAGEMLDGLGLAETTPGPLIMVLQFVGFMAAWRDAVAAGAAAPLLAGTAGGLLATWVTFAPCFAWIFLGAPYMERLRSSRPLSAALSAVTAAVVGVILNLALWFAMHVIWRAVEPVRIGPLAVDLPVPGTFDPAAAALSALALAAVFWLRLGLVPVMASSAGFGLALHAAGWV